MGRRKNQNYLTSEFYCVECGNKGIPIPRFNGAYREAGHLKKLFCVYCQKETNHCEIRSNYTYEDFQLERKLGRFVNGVRIPVEDLLKCSNLDCPYNVKNRCWDCIQQNNCNHRPK